MISEINEKLTAYMLSVGILPTEDLILDGQLHRFHIDGDAPSKRNGWLTFELGEWPFAHFGSWKSGRKFTWQLKTPSSPEEMKAARKVQKEARKQYEADREKKYKQAAENAGMLLNNAVLASADHPYLIEKQIRPNGIKELDGALLIPMYIEKELASLQAIYPTGEKRFLHGGRVKGCHYIFGMPCELVYIAEGFATACTLREQYNAPVVTAFTAGNLESVAKDISVNYPGAEIIIAADNDQWTTGNPGMAAARKAALLVGGKIMSPNFNGMDTSSKPTDFNDYVRLGGDLCQ